MSAQLTANGSIPPRPGNALQLYKEKLKVIAEFMVIDTSPSAVRAKWENLSKHEKDELTREAKERKNAFDKMYPDWKNKTPKNKQVANNMEELRKTAQVPREAKKFSLAAGMPMACGSAPRAQKTATAPLSQARKPTQQVICSARRLAHATPPPIPHQHHQNSWIRNSEAFSNPGGHGRVCPQNHAILQRPKIQETKQQENQNAVKMYMPRQTAPHRHNPY